MDEKLKQVGNWTVSRLWPKRYPELEAAFENFLLVLQDFRYVFHQHTGERNDTYYTIRFYKSRDWIDDYHLRYEEYVFHVDLVQDLMLELTRAANYICDQIRKFIDPTFQLYEGAVLVESGPNDSMTFELIRVEYREEERVLHPYPGLEQFKIDRTKRDGHFGR